ncbi:MAG TPA: FCD domain-containing protein [Burkholderiaceae bacterium]|nr:FCD domain-containing protein [Burkholderiaceae bacterium]
MPTQTDPTKRAPAAAAIELLRENSLAMLAQRELERRIVSGELAVGAKLNEVDIANALGVSRGPVREAFRALDQAGLVRVEKNRGVFVRQLSLDEANEVYEVRAALEGLIGRLAAQRIDPDEIEQLRAIVKKMAVLDKSRKAEAYFALNLEFHELVARAARNGSLLTHYRRVVNELDLYRRETIARSIDSIAVSTREHEAIVNALAKGDERLAERLLVEHVLHSRERLHGALAKSARGARAE